MPQKQSMHLKKSNIWIALLVIAALVIWWARPSVKLKDQKSTGLSDASFEFSPQINANDFGKLVETLSSDAFEGRAPGSAGEEKTVNYLIQQMQRIGLKPGNGERWAQPVPMLETTVAPTSTITFTQNDDTPQPLSLGEDIVVSSHMGEKEIHIKESDLVFVGYGVDAPEHQWNDYAGTQDWKGKTVVMLINDPGFHTHNESLFDGKRMTYYGRWTYKFEEAARKGADAAIIIHDAAGASYGWDVVNNSWSGPQYSLATTVDPEPRLSAQAWMSQEAARALFEKAGLNLDKAYLTASQPGFKPISLKAKVSFDLNVDIQHSTSNNVIGVLPGSEAPDEAILYMAHWDHLGTRNGENSDAIYNGAIDNATGVAGVLEIAEAFTHQIPKPKRSIVFLMTTLEESGLLGSKYYVIHPTFPLSKIAGVLNLDAMSVAGKARDVTVTGFGASQLEDILQPLAAAQGRTLHAESSPQSGSYFRSDHFNFAKSGVPALYLNGGRDLIEGGKEQGENIALDYAQYRYHSPADEYTADTWKLDGTIQDLELLYGVGKNLADSGQWPDWYEGNAFKPKRDAMMKTRAPSP